MTTNPQQPYNRRTPAYRPSNDRRSEVDYGAAPSARSSANRPFQGITNRNANRTFVENRNDFSAKPSPNRPYSAPSRSVAPSNIPSQVRRSVGSSKAPYSSGSGSRKNAGAIRGNASRFPAQNTRVPSESRRVNRNQGTQKAQASRKGASTFPQKGVFGRKSSLRENSFRKPSQQRQSIILQIVQRQNHQGITLLSRSESKRFALPRANIVLFLIPLILVILLVAWGFVNAKTYEGKIYHGVSVGSVDLSGKTKEEARGLITLQYGPGIAANSVIVYADEEAKTRSQDEVAQLEMTGIAEQSDYEEAQQALGYWSVNAKSLDAKLPVDELVQAAYAAGRTNGGFFTRLKSRFIGHDIDPFLKFDTDKVEKLLSQVESTQGDPLINPDVIIVEGIASAVAGQDGYSISRSVFKQDMETLFLGPALSQPASYLPAIAFEEQQIEASEAQEAADYINKTLSRPLVFNYKEISWSPDAVELGSWIKTSIKVDAKGNPAHLEASFDASVAKPALLSELKEQDPSADLTISLDKTDSNVYVNTNGVGEIPLVEDSLVSLNKTVFPEKMKWTDEVPGEELTLNVASGPTPARLTADEAIDYGVIGEIASYSTDFTVSESVENRNYNIRLASELINDSIVKVDGEWSFNDVAGNCNAERGFLGAGAIVEGEYADEIGGGICQVATTVFNAVFESGFPVTERHNHSLYIASYPQGRDAAVSYPDLNLRWGNDSANDVLLRTAYSEGSLKVILYGISPKYTVSSEVGEWEKGKTFSKKKKTDPNVGAGVSYVKTVGSDGSSITVIRNVFDKDGKQIRTDSFVSKYDPVDEITVVGEG